MTADRRKRLLGIFSALFIMAAVAAVYAQAPGGERVFDDVPLLKLACNQTLQSFDLSGACAYRPVRHLSFAISGSLFGAGNDVAHHWGNIVLHILAALGVWGTLIQILKSRPGVGASADDTTARVSLRTMLTATIAALLFAVHPANVDAVAYLSGRRDVLCGLFFILAFVSLTRVEDVSGRLGQIGLLAVGGLLWLLALGSKEMAVTLPAIVLWYEFAVRVPRAVPTPDLKARLRWLTQHRLKYFAPAFAVALAYIVWRGVIDSKSFWVIEGNWWGGTWWTNLMTGVSLQRYFAEIILLPLRLPGDWNTPMILPVESFASVPFWVGGGIVIGLLGLIWHSLKTQQNLIAFGLGWYLLAVLPVSHIIPHHEIFAEHYAYIPLMGLVIAGAAKLNTCAAHLPVPRQKMLWAGMLSLAILLGLRANIHVDDYRNPYALGRATLSWSPAHPRAALRVGTWLFDQDRPEDGEVYLLSILHDNPHATPPLRKVAYEVLGFYYFDTQQTHKFATIAQNAVHEFPDNPTFHGMMGMWALHHDGYNQGLQTLREVASRSDTPADFNFIAAMEYRKAGDLDLAVQLLEKGVEKAPTQNNMALALAHLLLERDPARSRQLVEAVLSRDPESIGARQLSELLKAL